MLEYYLSRSEQIKSDLLNGHASVMGASVSVDEVEEETFVFARFILQNEVSNVIDNSMEQIGGAFASHLSAIQ